MKKGKGEIVVEASLVVTIAVIFIAVMVYLGFVMYQRTMLSVMANQTASNIAQLYSNNIKDPFTGYVDPSRIYQDVSFEDIKTGEYVQKIERKAKSFAKYRLKSSSIIPIEEPEITVSLERKPNDLLKSQIVVEARTNMTVPLVGFFGTAGRVSFTASGRADCVDVLEYMHGVKAVEDPNKHAYAMVREQCMVTFITYNGQLFATVPAITGYSINGSSAYTTMRFPQNPTYGTWRFTGWQTEDGSPFTADTVVNGDMTVYGKWMCTVTFSAPDAQLNKTSVQVEVGKAVGSQWPTVKKPGKIAGYFWTLDSWKNGAGAVYTSATPIYGDTSLTAYWKPCNPHQWREDPSRRTGVACGGVTTVYVCGVCGAEKTESVRGTGCVYGCCSVDHPMTRYRWSYCTSYGSPHVFNTYRHRVCIYCKHEGDVWGAKYLDDNGTYHTMYRASIWCGNSWHNAVPEMVNSGMVVSCSGYPDYNSWW